MARNKMWRFVYLTYPPILRILERLGFHAGRQPFLLGYLNQKHSPENLRMHLIAVGFEDAILAWRREF